MHLRLALLAISLLLLGALAAAAANSGDIARRPTSIAPQELADALQALANDRKVQLVYRSELVTDLRAPSVSGVLTLEEALTQLLYGSGLAFRFLSDDAITIVKAE